jgi:DNA-directed RNA polymerase specialized sigma24 family protein
VGIFVHSAFSDILRDLFDTIYHLAYRVTLHEGDAALIVRETFVRSYQQLRQERALTPAQRLLVVLQASVDAAQEQQRSRDVLSFEELDATIRGDPTLSGVDDHLTDPQRNRLLWELKQGCLTAVVNCLPPGERLAFILCEILGQGGDQAAEVLRISPSALRVRVSRARKKISAYLAPRCEHVDPRNPCHCPSRLGVALTRGFISEVRGRQVSLRARPFDEEPPQHDPIGIFHTLPGPEAPQLLEELLHDLEAGIWD